MSKGASTAAWAVTLGRAGYGVALLCAPQVLIRLTGGVLDVLHATTMVGLAAADQGARRVALADTGVELTLAATGRVTALR